MTERERLIAFINNYPCMSTAEDCFIESISEDLADYLLANGVIVPPCKVGDTVFIIDDYDCDPYVLQVKVNCIKSDKLGEWIGVRYPLGMKYNPVIPITDVGKTVFLTRAEAEKALAERGKQ